MEQRQLGRTSVELPVVGLGTWRRLEVADGAGLAGRLVQTALDNGLKLFDSSPMYGRAERILGRELASRRSEAVVATKVWANSADDGRKQASQALELFGGHVELYQVHNLVAWRHQLPLLERLKAEGKVTAVGITHYAAAEEPEFVELMRTARPDFVQVPYNPRERGVEEEILPLAADLGMGVLVMRPLAEGGLTRRAPSAEALQPLEAFGIRSWGQALLKWALSDGRVSAVIPATSLPERILENVRAGSPPWFGSEELKLVERLAA